MISLEILPATKDANGGVIPYRYNSQGKVCGIIVKMYRSKGVMK